MNWLLVERLILLAFVLYPLWMLFTMLRESYRINKRTKLMEYYSQKSIEASNNGDLRTAEFYFILLANMKLSPHPEEKRWLKKQKKRGKSCGHSK